MPRTPDSPDEELEEDDSSEEENEDESSEDESPAEAAATVVEEAPPKKKIGRPKGSRTTPKTRPIGDGAPPKSSKPLANLNEWPKEAIALWPKILEWVQEQGRGASDVLVAVHRQLTGPFIGESTELSPFLGSYVEGSANVSPSEALMQYIIDVYHNTSAGPSLYTLNFRWRSGGALIKTGELRLDSFDRVMQSRNRAAMYQAAQPQQPQGMGMGYPQQQPFYPSYSQPPMQQPMRPPPPTPSQAPHYYPPGPQQDPYARDSVEGLRRDVSVMLGRLDEAERQRAAGLGVAPPPPLSPTPQPDDAQQNLVRTIVGVLDAMGFRPNNNQVGVGNPGVQTALPPDNSINSVVRRTQEQVGGLREFVKIFKELENVRSDLGIGGSSATDEEEAAPLAAPLAVVADPNEPPFGVKPIPFSGSKLSGGKPLNWVTRGEDEAMTDWLLKMGASNPEASMTIVEMAMRIVDQGAIGGLLRKLAAQGGPQAAAVAQVQQNAANGAAALGTGAPPGGYPTA
jgi:hypothetical protein